MSKIERKLVVEYIGLNNISLKEGFNKKSTKRHSQLKWLDDVITENNENRKRNSIGMTSSVSAMLNFGTDVTFTFY